jgi:hypothetical protein
LVGELEAEGQGMPRRDKLICLLFSGDFEFRLVEKPEKNSHANIREINTY